MKPTAKPAVRALFPMGTGPVDPADKSARILKAALDLFVRYGIKRTSIDDIAREAGIAKGTLYLYYPSKDALFTAVAERICAERLVLAREASASAGALVDKLVAILDCQFGVMCRVIAESPHVAELEASRAFAAATYDKFDRDIERLIKEALSRDGISGRNVPEMLMACAIGMVEICGTNEKLFRERLAALVDTLIQGLRARELTPETALPKPSIKPRQQRGATDSR